jgi:steroid delta-isomerase-like uncharacterized protein
LISKAPTVTDTEALVRRYVEEVWNRGSAASVDELTTSTFTYHLGGQPPRDRAALAQFIAATRQAFPDWRVEVDQAIADAARVAIRWHGRVTHRGVFHGVPPTGRAVTVTGINMYAISGNRIDSEWEQTDALGLLQQLGALPA